MSEEGKPVGTPVGEPTEPPTTAPTVSPTEEQKMNELRGDTRQPTTGPSVPPTEAPTAEWYCKDHGAVIPKVVSGRKFCPVCNTFVSREPYEIPTPSPLEPPELEEGRGPLIPEGPPMPPEVQMIEEAREFISERLAKQVFGISEGYKKIVMNALKDDPSALRDGNILHGFIKNLAPKAYDPHLTTSVIRPLYIRFPSLPQAVMKYLAGLQQPTPSMIYQQPIGPWGYPPTSSMGYDQYGRPMTQLMPQPFRRKMTIMIDGQQIDTDYEGFMAHERWKRDKEKHDLEMKELEARILKIHGESESGTAVEPVEEVREFLDGEGNLCDPEKAVSVRIRKIPMGRGDSEVKVLREEIRDLKETLGKRELDQLREEIKELKKKPETSEEVNALQQQLNESRKSIEDLKGTIENKDKQVLLDKVGGLEKRLSDLAATGTGEWKTDEIRLIKGGITDIKELLQSYLTGERPLDRAERILTGQGPPGSKVPSEMAGETERGTVIRELRKKGLTTRILERGK